MKALSGVYNEVVDGRYVSFSAKFYNLSTEQYRQLNIDYYLFLLEFFNDNCVIKCTLETNKKESIKSISQLENAVYKTNVINSLEFVMDVKNDRVFNKTTQSLYNKKILYTPSFGRETEEYDLYYEKYVRSAFDSKNKELIKKSLINLYSKVDFERLMEVRSHDYYTFTIGSSTKKGLWCGEISGIFYIYSLDDKLDEFVEKLEMFSKELSTKYTNINIIVKNENTSTKDIDGARNGLFGNPWLISNEEWNKLCILNRETEYLYMNDVGWLNIISPTVWALMGEKIIESSDIEVEQYINRAYGVKLKKNLSRTTINDYKKIRKLNYDVIVPTTIEIPYDCNFREDWGNYPVLDDEIFVNDDSVTLKHSGKVNIKYLEENWLDLE